VDYAWSVSLLTGDDRSKDVISEGALRLVRRRPRRQAAFRARLRRAGPLVRQRSRRCRTPSTPRRPTRSCARRDSAASGGPRTGAPQRSHALRTALREVRLAEAAEAAQSQRAARRTRRGRADRAAG
jgi:hypothetical protein